MSVCVRVCVCVCVCVGLCGVSMCVWHVSPFQKSNFLFRPEQQSKVNNTYGALWVPPTTTTTTTTPLHPSPTLGTAPSQVSRPGLWALVRGSHSGHCCRQERVIPLVLLTPQCHAECHATTLSPVLRWHVGPAPWRVPSQNGDVSWRLHALTVTSGSGQVCRRG